MKTDLDAVGKLDVAGKSVQVSVCVSPESSQATTTTISSLAVLLVV